MLHWILLGLTCWGRVVGTSNQMSYENLCEVKSSGNSECLTYNHVSPQNIHSQQNLIINSSNFNNRDGFLLILEETDLEFDYYQYHDNGTGCFYLESNSLVFMFLTRAILIVISLEFDSVTGEGILSIPSLGVCNTSCGFTWNSEVLSGNCSTYKMLTTLVQGRQQQCYNKNISINVSVNKEMVTITVDNSELLTVSNNIMEFIDCRAKIETFTTIYDGVSKTETLMVTNTYSITSNKLVTSTTMGISRSGLSYVSTSTSSPSSCTKNCAEATPKFVVGLTAGISTSISIIALLIILLIAVLLIYNKIWKSAKQNPTLEHQDGPESPQPEANTNPYEQVYLSEFIPSAENEAISNQFWQPQADLQGIYSCIDTEHPYPIAKPVTQVTEITILDNPAYETIDNSRKENSKEQHINNRQDGLPVPLNSQDTTNDQKSSLVENEPNLGDEALEGMYAVVNKNRKEDEDAPPVPPHTTEELYTAVAKTSKVKATGDEEKTPIPSEIDSEDNTENEEVAPQLPPRTVEELYTAVQKKPKKGAEDEEEAPPIPPYTGDTAVKIDSKDKAENEAVTPQIRPRTDEELYTAVQEKPKKSAEDEEKAPPIPPYVGDKL